MSCFDAGRSWRQTLPLRLTTEGPHCQPECSLTGSEESGLAGWGAWMGKWPTLRTHLEPAASPSKLRRDGWGPCASSGEPHGVSTAAEYIVARDGTIVLARHLQLEAMDRIYDSWKQTEQGQELAEKAWSSVDARAREIAQRAQRQQNGPRPAFYPFHGHGAGASTPYQTVGASTPDHAVGTDEQFDRVMRKYFRNHCDQAYGGQLWLKFLIALDRIPDNVVSKVNALAVYRTEERRGEYSAATVPDATPGNIFLSREDRASTSVANDYVGGDRSLCFDARFSPR